MTTICEGILKKEGKKTTVFGVQVGDGIEESYFVLQPRQLSFWKKKPSGNEPALGVIDLYKTVVTALPGLKFSVGGSLLTRTYLLEALNQEDKDKWIKALKVAQGEHKNVEVSDFKLLLFIGEGGWGQVYKVQAKDTSNIYAMKVIDKSKLKRQVDVNATLDERQFLQEFHHPFIVRLHFTFQTNDKLYLLMDYLSGGDAFYLLSQHERFSEQAVHLWTAEIAMALSHLHTHNVIYRDLKPENCVLDSRGHMVLTDFGLSKRTETGRRKTRVGTQDYMAPEMIQGLEYSYSTDFWALGCFAFEMSVGHHPFQNEEGQVPVAKVLQDHPQYPDTLSPEAQDFIGKLLCKVAEQRMQSLEAVQSHPWMKDLDFDKVYHRQVESSFTPNPNDIMNFDPCYTSQRPVLKPSDPGQHFEGFSWDGSE